MRKILLALVACCSVAGMAQQVTITKQQQLLKGVESGAYYPVLSADGTKLLFTASDSKGLKLYDFNDDVVTVITDADRAGFAPQITDDGLVYYVKQNADDLVKYRTAVCYNIADKSSKVLVENVRNISVPVLLNGGAMMHTSKGLVNTVKSVKQQGVSVYAEGSKIIINRNGKEAAYSPVESYAGCFWASLSPDKTKVAFFAAGKGIVVMDLNGKVLANLGNYEMPSWMGNDYIVAQNTKDDGHQFTSSQIMLLKADGSWKKELTSKTSMTMQPTASSAARRIVYSTIDGNLFMMELSIND